MSTARMQSPELSAAPKRAARAFIEHCCQEALAIIEENKPVVLALAQALIDHPERTLDAAQIDQVIAQAVANEVLAIEQARRIAWRRTVENAASFASST